MLIRKTWLFKLGLGMRPIPPSHKITDAKPCSEFFLAVFFFIFLVGFFCNSLAEVK